MSPASVERNFSMLKKIKNHSRNNVPQDRLSNISLTSMEQELVREMCQDNHFYENVTDYFAKTKNRLLPLAFKAE